jgi:tRNA-guanine family transglycosylase
VPFQFTEGDGAGRLGELVTTAQRLKTPALIPVVDLLTGPPGLGRNGGIWRHCKNGLIKEAKADAIVVQAVHFIDFNLSTDSFNQWFEGPKGEGGFGAWLDDYVSKGKRPVLFVDSGGFKLLYNDPPDLSRYSLEVSPKHIFNLQERYSADIVASLDYPLPPGLSFDEQRTRTRKNIRNAMTLMKQIRENTSKGRPFPFLCVHGVDYESVNHSTKLLLRSITRASLGDLDFGLAIGSLVPIRNHDDLIFAIIRGVRDAISSSSYEPSRIPIHVFGVSSSLIPLLPAVGVDTFDSSTYAQAAANLRYLNPLDRGPSNFLELDDLHCECESCSYIRQGGLDRSKRILKGKPLKVHEFGNEMIAKSRIHGAIAVHNWQVQKDEVNRTIEAIGEGRLADLILSLAKRSWKYRRILSAAVAANPNLRTTIADSHLLHTLPGPREVKPPKLSLAYTPESFDLSRRHYQPEHSRLLVLSCTATKPYSSSRSHRFVETRLGDFGIAPSDLEIVTISGLYGPVPRTMEGVPQVMRYDFRLSSWNRKQIDIVVRRTEQFFRKHALNFQRAAAFVAAEPYRTIVRRASASVPDFRILPSKKGRVGFYDQNEIRELSNFLAHDVHAPLQAIQ